MGLGDFVAKYYVMCEWFDETCGQLLEKLEAEGLRENILVVYVCDNGWIQSTDRNGYTSHSRRIPYEMGTRTPILFSWLGRIDATDRPELCTSIYISNTIIEAAGVEVPNNCPGMNLLPALESGKKIRRDTIFGEAFPHDIADVHKPEDSLLYRWVIEDDWKRLLRYDGQQGSMKYPPDETGSLLVDLNIDPHERNNQATPNPKLVVRLAHKIAHWWPVTERKVVGLE